jgi:hypothetical protein
MFPPLGYVEINRRFSRLQGSDHPDELASASYLRSSLADSLTLGWDELLNVPLVVILGEPGSGKSWEFRWHCATL